MGVPFRNEPKIKTYSGVSQNGYGCPTCSCKRITPAMLRKIKNNTDEKKPNRTVSALYTEYKTALTSHGINVHESIFANCQLTHRPQTGGSTIYRFCRINANTLSKYLNLTTFEEGMWADWIVGEEDERVTEEIWTYRLSPYAFLHGLPRISHESERRRLFVNLQKEARKNKEKYVNLPPVSYDPQLANLDSESLDLFNFAVPDLALAQPSNLHNFP